MKVLFFKYRYFMYPECTSSLEEFIDYANKHYNSFIRLTELSTDNCRPPYFIKEDIKTVYINISSIDCIREYEIAEIIPRTEYEKRLKKIVFEKCVHCKNYTEEIKGDNLSGHWTNISLDGDCYEFTPIED